MVQVVADDLEGEIVESPVTSCDGDEAVAEIHVVELEPADVAGTRCVNGSEGEGQAVFRCRCGGDDLLVVGWLEGQDGWRRTGPGAMRRVGFLKISRWARR